MKYKIKVPHRVLWGIPFLIVSVQACLYLTFRSSGISQYVCWMFMHLTRLMAKLLLPSPSQVLCRLGLMLGLEVLFLKLQGIGN